MQFVRYEARMRRPADDKGNPTRAHLEGLASRGDSKAAADLIAPPLPEPLEYLWDWSQELYGRSGVGMSGLAPLSYGTVADWARLTDREPKPHEVEALMVIDSVLLTEGRS